MSPFVNSYINGSLPFALILFFLVFQMISLFLHILHPVNVGSSVREQSRRSLRRVFGLRCAIPVCFVCAGLFIATDPVRADGPININSFFELQSYINGDEYDDFILQHDISNSNKALIIPAGKDITIDLNGRNISRYGGPNIQLVNDGYVIKVQGKLTIKDSGGVGGTFTGMIMGGRNNGCGGGVFVDGGNFILEDGMITQNHAVQGDGVCRQESWWYIHHDRRNNFGK